jgi:hypothetical protein
MPTRSKRWLPRVAKRYFVSTGRAVVRGIPSHRDHENRATTKARIEASKTRAVASHHFLRIRWREASLP